jgi:predicted transcriptional regulator
MKIICEEGISLYDKLEEMEIIWEDGEGNVKWNKKGQLTKNQLALLKRIKFREV